MFLNQSFVLYHDNGKIEFVDNLYSYVWGFGGINRFYGAMKYNVAEYKKKTSQSYGTYFSPTFEHDYGFYLCTSSGMLVSPDLFLSGFKEKERTRWEEYYKNRKGVQGQTSHNTRIIQKVRTIPAKRAACSVLKDEGEPPFRGKRSKGFLPDTWDDYFSRRSCSWKTCTKRKRQYKGS